MIRNMIDSFRLTAVLAVCVLLAAASCRTDYSQEGAETARRYALKNLHGLTEDQRHFIQFTQPVIYSNVIFPRYVVPAGDTSHIKVNHPSRYMISPAQDYMHHCFVWAPPDMDGNLVAVVGEGERSLRFWEPYRVLVKKYVPGSPNYESAKKAAAAYAMNSMLFLTVPELNRVRFSEPEVIYTKFPLEVKTAVNEDDRTPWEAYLAERDVKKEIVLTQISLVWPGDRAGEYVVISGFSPNGCLYSWRIQSAQYAAASDLGANTLSPAETAAIVKDQGPREGKLVFPEERRIDRGNRGKETGAIFGGGLTL